MNELLYRIALTRIKGINLPLAKILLEATGCCEALFAETEENINRIALLKTSLFSDKQKTEALKEAETELDFIDKNKIDALFYTDPDYPQRLTDCIDAPILLYYKGSAKLNQTKIISIVGTRNATNYGKGFCQDFIKDLSALFPNTIIVSGLAYGIDVCAHRAAIQNGLDTIAVLAHGLNTIYPAPHRNMAADILKHGGLLTEYASQSPIHRGNFVARNRIVAGLSDATVIIESAAKGGSLITADIAESYHRDVFALPGRIGDTYSQGCNSLIASNKAALISSARHFADLMCWEIPTQDATQKELFPELDEKEMFILNILEKDGECQINQLAIKANMPTSHILAILLELEFKNKIRSFPGGIYRPA